MIQSPFSTILEILFSKKHHTKTRSFKKTNKIDEETGRTQQASAHKEVNYAKITRKESRTEKGKSQKASNHKHWWNLSTQIPKKSAHNLQTRVSVVGWALGA
jgi:hypothetical protein